MPPRRGAVPVEEEEEPRPGGLVFNSALSWRAGKPIATAELLKRLDELSTELREKDDDIDQESLRKVAKELAGKHLLGHKDKGVRAFTGCCLVDILKLCAPDAPYAPTELKDIFTFFITAILPSLSDPSSAYNTQHKYVLESLGQVKSVVLLTDIPASDQLILHLFSSFFDIISGSSKSSTGESIAKDVEYNMTQILVILVDEVPALPVTAVDVIVAQFLRASTPGGGKGKNIESRDEKQSTLLMKELPEAYNMAKTICNSCPEKMARYVSQYFNEVILDVSTGIPPKTNGHRKSNADMDFDEDDAPAAPTEADMKELEKAHKLLRELWRASPSVLQNVIPQLEAELSAENVDLRLLATQTLGDIISGIGAAGPPPPPTLDPAVYPPAVLEEYTPSVPSSILITPSSPQSFATTHPSVYQNFLGRRNDKSAPVRSAWSTAVGRILVTSAGGIGLSQQEQGSLVRGLAEKLNDSDERVRIAAVKAIGDFNFSDVITKLAPTGGVGKSGSALCSLADRARDRKHAVQVEGMTTLSRIWGVAVGEITSGNEIVIEALGDVPSKMFNTYYTNDKELNVLLDRVMFEQLLPLNYPPSKPKRSRASNGTSQSQNNSTADVPADADKIRSERILVIVNSLDAKALKAFFAMQARQPTYSKVLTTFLKLCEDFNGGVSDGSLKETKAKIEQVINWLSGFLPDPLLVSSDLHKYAKLHDRRTYQLLRFAMAPESDFKTVANAIKEFTKRIKESTQPGLMGTLMPIIYRSASLVYNRSHQPTILQYSRNDEHGLGMAAKKIIAEISEKLPHIFQANVKELAKSLGEQAPTQSKANEPGAVDTLKALASFAKAHPEQIPKDRKFIQTLISFASYGTPAKAAKYAVSILMEASDRKEMHAKDLLEKSTANWEFAGDHFLTKLATISQLTLLDPKTIKDAEDEILEITTAQLLLQTRTTASEDDPEWQPDSGLDEECQAKCWALKILVNRLRTIEDPETAKNVAIPVYKVLNTLITLKGEINKSSKTPLHHRNRLRLLAAQLMLKLCTKKMFDDFLSPKEFNRLALVCQDEFADVRHGFISKLQKYLVKDRLSHRFISIIFLTAFEPEPFGSSLATWIRSRVKIASITQSKVFESLFPRLLHLLAHHPDYSDEPNDLKDNSRYILYYLNTVASEENVALLFKYAERVKQARDALDPELENIYVYSDVAQTLIRIWLDKKGWTMQTWPTKVGMPIGLFAALPSHEVAQKIAEKSFLPDGMDDLLEDLVKTSGKKVKKTKRKAEDKDGEPVAKKVKSSSTREPKVRKDRQGKERKTPKPKRAKDDAFSTPAQSSGDRRRSGRGASARKSYADRDSSDDDEEMWEGVAEWEYMDEDGNPQEKLIAAEDAKSDRSNEESEKEATPELEEVEEEPSPDPESEQEGEDNPEDEEDTTPPKASTRNGRNVKAAAKKPTPKGKVARAKPQSKTNTPVKPKAKAPIVAKRATRHSKERAK